MMQPCSNNVNMRRRTETNMAAAKGKTAVEIDSWKHQFLIQARSSGLNQRTLRLVGHYKQETRPLKKELSNRYFNISTTLLLTTNALLNINMKLLFLTGVRAS